MKKIMEAVCTAMILFVTGLLLWSFGRQDFRYQMYETDPIHYVKARTVEILEQELTEGGAGGEYVTGYQKLCIQFLEGEKKGQELELENYVTVQHPVIAGEGSRLIICADEPDNAEPYYTVYNYDRSMGIWLLVGGFLLLAVLVGRKQGLLSCVGLLFTAAMIVCFLLPGLYRGSGMGAAAVTVTASCAVTCFCIGGFTKKTGFNVISAILGSLSAGAVYRLCTSVLRLNGCSMDEGDALVLIAQAEGLRLNSVLYSGVIVSAMGAVMDVAVSMGASLGEIASLNPGLSGRELFRSGMRIGRDMTGTMTNTLILAFAGSSLATLLIFISYGVQYHQLLSSNFLALELSQGLSGSAAVILTVPISAAVNAVGYGLLIKKETTERGGKMT